MHEDWTLLLSTILHPCCSGADGVGSCLGGRFRHAWKKVGGEWQQPASHAEMMDKVKVNAQRVLREELRLQYEIDHPDTSGPASATASAAASGTTNPTDPTAPKKRKLLWNEGGTPSAATAEPTAAPDNKEAAVEAEMNRWLSRTPNGEGSSSTTMLDFWKTEPSSMLRRVAVRAGAFMLSQCATERVNKLPKAIWNPSRMSLQSQSVIRDVFLVARASCAVYLE